MLLLKAFMVVLICLQFQESEAYDFETFYFDQKVDHFSYTSDVTYKQRYLVARQNFAPGGPLFFYAGNEGNIYMFANNTGLMFDWAPEFNALIVFAEHRYYGESQPFGKKSYLDPAHLGYLTTEQALADFAVLIDYLKKTTDGLQDSPVIAFGGSYGGMLAAWLRMKYPHVVDGALCASGPVLQFTGITPCYVFSQLTTKPFRQASAQCPRAIQRSWGIVRAKAQTEDGRKQLSDIFKLCSDLRTQDVDNFVSWLSNTWTNAAMTNYPYPSSFLMPVPANPVNEMCKKLPNATKPDDQLLADIITSVGVFQNYTGQTKCYDILTPGGADMGDEGWDFQSCTEMVMPMCSDGVQDMFEPAPWDFEAFKKQCQVKWGVTPQAQKARQMYGGRHINASSNIIFSNGLLDPWSGGGVLKSISESLVAILIPEGAHHLDLRAANPADPISVINARKLEKQLIKKWAKEAKAHNLEKRMRYI